MKTSFVGAKTNLRYAHFPGGKIVNTHREAKNPRGIRVFGRLRTEFCVKESSHVIAKCDNSTFLRQ